MPRIRSELSKKNEYWISKHAFYTAYHYALQYNDWKNEYEAVTGGLRAVNYDGMPHSSSVSNPTETAGMRGAELHSKMRVIEALAEQAEPTLSQYILKAVTNEDITYEYLRMKLHIPCGHNEYYKARRRFYYLLSKHLEEG